MVARTCQHCLQQQNITNCMPVRSSSGISNFNLIAILLSLNFLLPTWGCRAVSPSPSTIFSPVEFRWLLRYASFPLCACKAPKAQPIHQGGIRFSQVSVLFKFGRSFVFVGVFFFASPLNPLKPNVLQRCTSITHIYPLWLQASKMNGKGALRWMDGVVYRGPVHYP